MHVQSRTLHVAEFSLRIVPTRNATAHAHPKTAGECLPRLRRRRRMLLVITHYPNEEIGGRPGRQIDCCFSADDKRQGSER